MLEWLASLLVFLLHGQTAKAVASQPNHSTSSGTVHALDSPAAPTGSSPVIDGGTEP